MNLEELPYPFDDNEFDEIHAYEVLEHTGRQGDWKFFFDQFSEFHRILKPDGYFFATVPGSKSEWIWGDPGHTRHITKGTLVFLSKEQYQKQVGNNPMTDYRFYWKKDFALRYIQDDGEKLEFAIKAIK